MGTRIVARLLGRLLGAYALFMAVPLGYALLNGESAYLAFVFSSCITAALGALLFYNGEEPGRITSREGFLIVAGTWLLAGATGAMPYWFSGWVPTYLDAVFETVSGLTTTGASVIPDVESLPRSLLLWRSMTQWLGGMGIIVLFVVFLTNVGADAVNLFRAESPGPTVERVLPRIRTMALILWRLYVIFTIAEIALLMLAGMSLFDAVNHAFTTMATGGFSTMNASVKQFDNLYIELIITFFMFAAGSNFALYYLAWQKGVRRLFQDTEFKTYLGIMAASVLSIAALLHVHNGAGVSGLRDSLFTVTSIMTTTGYATADFDQWPSAAKIILLMLMLLGGCAGSTAGGIKVVRLLILLKDAAWSLLHAVHPKLVSALKIDKKPVDAGVLHMVLQFFFLFLLIYFVSVLLVAATGLTPFDAIGAVAASLGNVGPGFGVVGPTTTYADLAPLAKAVLTVDMLLGRLELFTVLVLFHPEFWQPYMLRRRSTD
ncbi:TrkH family potassium uptake protein [Anaeroselena agilis]|uniref:TrkH family potassium uptake protein n=1 Tax=Anaeroselena agilis TaxID=3063788 RepID=A0ABU3P3A7_9FIRM|nr:TrkH family potassium uptake protein [Selenomonadales bacterium 4137-cl]